VTVYSYGQLEGLWIAAGGSTATAPLAAALAEAESGGNSLAAYPGTTVAPGQGSNTDATGLWQILGVPSGFSPSQLTDPLENAKMAVAKWKAAGGFSPWQTYDTGSYSVRSNVPVIPWTGGGAATTTASTTTTGGGTVQGIQGNVPGVSAPGATASGAVSSGSLGSAGTIPDPSAPGGLIGFTEGLPLGIGNLFKAIEPLLHAVATVIDYSFAVFQPGQGQRALFALGALILAFLSYRVMAGSGSLPFPKVGAV